MQIDQRLLVALLKILAEKQTGLSEGDTTLVQPFVEGLNVQFPIRVAGYDDHDQIHEHLVELHKRQLIMAHTTDKEAMIGIWFSELTPAGRRVLQGA